MSDAFYTPPASDLNGSAKNESPFFTVSQTKLTVMFIVTSGLYGLYWCFRNWSHYRAYSGRPIWPLPRTLFGLLYLPSLFYKIDGTLKEQGKGRMPYWAASVAGVFILTFAPHIVGFLIGFFAALSGRPYDGAGIVTTLAVATLPLLLICLILRRVQSFINLLSGDTEGRSNATFTRWNILWMAIGVLYWIAGLTLSMSMTQASA